MLSDVRTAILIKVKAASQSRFTCISQMTRHAEQFQNVLIGHLHFFFCEFSVYFINLLFFSWFFETGFLCVVLAVLELTCRPGWPQTQKFACFCLPSAGIKGVRHHRPVKGLFLHHSFDVYHTGETTSEQSSSHHGGQEAVREKEHLFLANFLSTFPLYHHPLGCRALPMFRVGPPT